MACMILAIKAVKRLTFTGKKYTYDCPEDDKSTFQVSAVFDLRH
jgi:hypothetical protein